MKKQILNLGKALNKAEQKSIVGGRIYNSGCLNDSDCMGSGEDNCCIDTICHSGNSCLLHIDMPLKVNRLLPSY